MFGGYVWLRCVVYGCGWFWRVCSFGMSVVLGGMWLEGRGWLKGGGVDGYGVWVVVESVWLVAGDYAQINT